jgi:hypothetical protein
MGKMTDNGRDWLRAHPGAEPQIQFTAPHVGGMPADVVGTVEDAVAMGAIKCNGPGLELVKALWPWGQSNTPTYSMIQEVIERIYAPKS